MVHASPQSAKIMMRAEMRAHRRVLAAKTPDAAKTAAAVLPLDALPPVRVVSGYRAQGAEIDPAPLMRRLAAEGAKLALPVAVSRDEPLVFRAWVPDAALEPDAFGIPSPTDAAEELIPDLVIAPVLAFDAAGRRLGQGAGHYDRTLANLRAAGSVFVLGLAYAGQEAAEVPGEAHDQRLDAIVTENGYIEVRKDNS